MLSTASLIGMHTSISLAQPTTQLGLSQGPGAPRKRSHRGRQPASMSVEGLIHLGGQCLVPKDPILFPLWMM